MADEANQEKAAGGLGKIPPAAIIAFLLLDLVVVIAVVLYVFKPWVKEPPPEKPPPAEQQEEDKKDAALSGKTTTTRAAHSPDTAASPTPVSASVPAGHFRVAAIQFVSAFGDVKGNRARLAALVSEAAARGAQVVVFPEAAVPGYMSHDLQTAWRDPVRRPKPADGRSLVEAGVAETVPGESTRVFGELARKHGVYLVATLIEKVDVAGAAPRVDYFNTAVVLGPDGEVAGHYRKLNPWPAGEATWAQDGDRGLCVCETPYGKLGVLICYDLSSGTVQKLKARGAQTLLYPIGWVCSNSPAWFDEMLPEKVADWGVSLVGANWSVDREPTGAHAWEGWGYSRIIRADGKILAAAQKNTGSEILIADLPLPVDVPGQTTE